VYKAASVVAAIRAASNTVTQLDDIPAAAASADIAVLRHALPNPETRKE
jgi:hypothetical protein